MFIFKKIDEIIKLIKYSNPDNYYVLYLITGEPIDLNNKDYKFEIFIKIYEDDSFKRNYITIPIKDFEIFSTNSIVHEIRIYRKIFKIGFNTIFDFKIETDSFTSLNIIRSKSYKKKYEELRNVYLDAKEII